MTLNINDKINEIFSNDSISKTNLLFSPKRKENKYNKNINDDKFNLNSKNEKTTEIKHVHSKTKKKKSKVKEDSNDARNYISSKKLSLNSNHNDDNNNNKKEKSQNSKDRNNQNKKTEKEEKVKVKEKEKEDNKNNNNDKGLDFLDYDFLERNNIMRGRGKSEHIKKNGTVFCFRGILNKSKKTKKAKVEIEKSNNNNNNNEERNKKFLKKKSVEINEVKKEKVEKKKNVDDKKEKEKEKDKDKEKTKLEDNFKPRLRKKNKSFYMKTKRSNFKDNDEISALKRVMLNTDIKKSRNKNPFEKRLNTFIDKKQKSAKKKKSITVAKSMKNILAKSKNPETKTHALQSKKTTITQKHKLKDEGKKDSDDSSSDMSSESNSNNKKKKNNKTNKKNENKKGKNNKNNDKDKDSAFQSSVFSDSPSNDELCLDKKLIAKNYKSSKNINVFRGVNKYNKFVDKNKNNNNNLRDDNRKSTKKIGVNEKDEKMSKDKKEKRKESDGTKIKSFHLDDESNSEVKLRKLSYKKKVGFAPQFQISRNVNNIFIFPKKENDNKGELFNTINSNHNMNIINPSNIISMEYNLNHGKKKARNIDLKSNKNAIINNNNDQNDLIISKKDTNNDFTQINTNKIQFKYYEKIESHNIKNDNNNNNNNNIIQDKKKPEKKSFFCCL